MNKGQRTITTALSVFISLGVVGYVMVELDWQTVRSIFAHLNWSWLSLAFAVFGINYLLRTLRFQALIYTQRVPFGSLLGVISLYGMMNYLLPAKSGEASYLVLLNRRLHISLTESTTTLVAARFFDFAAIALVVPIILIAFWQQLPRWIIYASIIFCLLVAVVGVGTLWLLRSSSRERHGKRRPSNSRLAKLYEIWRNLVNSFRAVGQHSQYAHIWLLTIGIWLCVYTNSYLIVLSMGYSVNYLEMIVVSIIMVPLTLLPLQGFANLGTHEVGWVTALALFGYSKDVSLTIAVGSHVILLGSTLLLGLVGLALITTVAQHQLDGVSRSG